MTPFPYFSIIFSYFQLLVKKTIIPIHPRKQYSYFIVTNMNIQNRNHQTILVTIPKLQNNLRIISAKRRCYETGSRVVSKYLY